MPGFVIAVGNLEAGIDDAMATASCKTIYSDKCSVSKIVSTPELKINQSYFKFLSQEPSASFNGCRAWCDGEIYNKKELGLFEQSFTEALIEHYCNNSLERFLAKVDGLFTGVIFDGNKRLFHLITDRYGLKTLYFSHARGVLFFGVELKCFTEFSKIELNFRGDLVSQFISLGHLMGINTWFKGIEVTSPSTIYSYSLDFDKLTESKYWHWDKVRSVNMDLADGAFRMADLLKKAVAKRKFLSERVGIGLSGGFDSRALLASCQEEKPVTYTFGMPSSKDVGIARKVASRTSVEHHIFNTFTKNWLEHRFLGIWKTDGMLNAYHMHYSHLMDEISHLMDINLSGFLGDVVLGGSYLEKSGTYHLDQRINDRIASRYYGTEVDFSPTSDAFYNIAKADVYMINNRGRRLVGMGMEEANKSIHQRLPFMDIELMDFAYSLPDSLRKNGKVYHAALAMAFPGLFTEIPHATTGTTAKINIPLTDHCVKAYNKVVWIARFKLGLAVSYSDVANWLRDKDVANFVTRLLEPESSLLYEISRVNLKEMYLGPHLFKRKNFAKEIMSAITIEIWMQQIFNKRYLNLH